MIFSALLHTKNRQRMISEKSQPKLWAYMAGILKTHGMHALAIGGMDDHAHALFRPALVAVRRNPHFRAYYRHLLAHGKFKMVALAAAMRKILHGIYGVFQTLQLFDANKLFTVPLPAEVA
jgi:hypothetical protein